MRCARAACVAALMLAAAAAWAEEKVVAGFEDAAAPAEWYASDGKLSVSTEHATEGKQSLKVELSPGDYPGWGVDFKGADWSGYDALRFSLFNEGREPQWVSIRIDDASSKGYGTRFNMEDRQVAVQLHMGANEIEIPIRSLRQGTPESQGIDPLKVASLRMFVGGLKKPVTWYLDGVRLVRAERKGPDSLVFADFDQVPGTVKAGPGTTIEPVDAPEGKPGKALKLLLTPDGDYPGVYVTPPADWLGYDALVFDVTCPEGTPTPGGLSIKIPAADRSMTLATGLQKGTNEICVPLDLASFLSQGRVKDLNLFWSRRQQPETVIVDNFRLVRERLADAPTRHAEAADTDRLTIDFTGLKVSRNTCLMTTAWIPLKAGGYRVVRANAEKKAQNSYGLDAEAFADYADSKPVRLWGMVLDHGVWHFCETHVPMSAAGRTKVTLDDKSRFGK